LLECGRALAGVTLHYAVYGRLNATKDNAVLVCHALTGSALVGSWWPEIFAPGAVLSLDHDFVICINMLGSCYGSTGPGSVNPETGSIYGPDFPLVSIRDNVRAQAKLLDSLGIRRLRLVLGGSIGGMQALDWAIYDPLRVQRALIIGVTPLSAMGLALNHLQRQAILRDPEWKGGRYRPQRPPRNGLAFARQIAMLSYKSSELFDERFGRKPNRNGEDPWDADGSRAASASLAGASTSPATSTTRGSGSSTGSTPTPIWPFCAPWTSGIRSADAPRQPRPLAGFAPASALSASAPIGSFRPRTCATLPIPFAPPAFRPITGR
jgi:homoserine O-acetyltransferase